MVSFLLIFSLIFITIFFMFYINRLLSMNFFFVWFHDVINERMNVVDWRKRLLFGTCSVVNFIFGRSCSCWRTGVIIHLLSGCWWFGCMYPPHAWMKESVNKQAHLKEGRKWHSTKKLNQKPSDNLCVLKRLFIQMQPNFLSNLNISLLFDKVLIYSNKLNGSTQSSIPIKTI